MVLATYPLEYMAAITPHANPEPTWRLYRALAAEAGVETAVSFETPLVSAALMRHEDGRVFVWCVSQSDAEIKAAPSVRGGVLRDEDGAPVSVVELPPYGVRVLELA
jgi:hypothetical protein